MTQTAFKPNTKPKWLLLAEKESRFHGRPIVDVAQILMGLIAFREGIASKALRKMGLSLRKIQCDFEPLVGFGSWNGADDLQYSKSVEKLIAVLVANENATSANALSSLIREKEPHTIHFLSTWSNIDPRNVEELIHTLIQDSASIKEEQTANEQGSNLDIYWEPENGFTWERLGGDLRNAKQTFNEQARIRKFRYITPDLMMQVILTSDEYVAVTLLQNARVDLDTLRSELAMTAKCLKAGHILNPDQEISYSHCAIRALEKGWDFAQEFGQSHIHSGSLLISLLREDGKIISLLKSKLGRHMSDLDDILRSTGDEQKNA